MLTLGITGGIGSGKSLVCRVLQHLGVAVYDCDASAKTLYDTDPELKDSMQTLFGEALYSTPSGLLDRAYLAQIIFSDQALLSQVNALVHPAVERDVKRWKEDRAQEGAQLIALESALLFSSEALLNQVDRTITVSAPKEVRIARAMRRDSASREAICQRMAAQLSQEELEQRADDIILNDGITHVLPQIDSLLSRLKHSL